MKKAWALFRSDLRRVKGSVMASVVLFGLVIIPMLFVSFNVLASWDPFANTSRLKVAVASEDSGYESGLMPVPINVGEQVLSELRANDQLDWVVTQPEEALDGARSGEYYAAIVLPESFSRDMLNFYANGSESAEIALHTNEKKNALAPTIASRGAEGVSTNIAESFSRTLGDVSLGLVAKLSDFLGSEDAQAAFDRIMIRAESLEEQMRAGARTARSMQGLMDSTIPLVHSAEEIINTPRPDIPTSDSDSSGPLDVSTDSLDAALSRTVQSYSVLGERIDQLYSNVEATQQQRSAALETMARQVQGSIDGYTRLRDTVRDRIQPVLPLPGSVLVGSLDDAIAAQESVRQRLLSTAQSRDLKRPDFSSIGNARKAIEAVKESDLREAVGRLQNSLQQLGGKLDAVDTPRSLDTTALANARDGVGRFADSLTEQADKFSDLRRELEDAQGVGDLERLAKLVGANPDGLSAALAAPVSLDRQAVYPVDSFGAGMAPLYTVLALWVGALLTAVALRTQVDTPVKAASDTVAADSGNEVSDSDTAVDELAPLQAYFGRFGMFSLIGLLQATLVSFGLLFFVELGPVHPVLWILATLLASQVFMFIVYALVSALGNAGKAVSVLLLVFQISSSGGAYPLQVLPEWFQNISPWLPATYAVHAFRSALAGVYEGDYWLSLGTLVLFILPLLLLPTLLRRPLAAYTTRLNTAMDSTRLM